MLYSRASPSTLNLATAGGAGLGPWVAGAVYDHYGSYAPAFWLAIVLCFMSIASIWLAAPRKVRAVAGRVARLHAEKANKFPDSESGADQNL